MPFLDGFRAVSIAMVMAWHVSGPHTIRYARRFQVWLGVDAFFVLSGFLITSLLVQERRDNGSFSLPHFYARRALRIFPAYVAFLTGMLFYYGRAAARPLAMAAVYLNDYDHGLRWGYFSSYPGGLHAIVPVWSLCVEEQFYLLWPLVLSLFCRLDGADADARGGSPPVAGLPRALKLTLVAVAAVLAWKAGLVIHDPGIDGDRLYYPFDTRADSILIGCAAALAWAHGPTRERIVAGLSSPWIPAMVVVALAVVVQDVRVTEESWLLSRVMAWVVALPMFAVLVATLILTLVVQPRCAPARALSHPVMVWIGRLSYSIYLWHAFAIEETQKRIEGLLAGALPSASPLLVELAAGAASLALGLSLAVLSHYVIERPFLRLKRRFEVVPSVPIGARAA